MKKWFAFYGCLLAVLLAFGCSTSIFDGIIGNDDDVDNGDTSIQLVWDKGGVNGSGAEEVTAINNPSWSHSGINYSVNTSMWPSNGENLNGYACFFIIRDNEAHGGKFEWIRSNTNYRDWKNLRDGYGGHRVPNSGEQVAFCVLSLDRQERSSVIFWTW